MQRKWRRRPKDSVGWAFFWFRYGPFLSKPKYGHALLLIPHPISRLSSHVYSHHILSTIWLICGFERIATVNRLGVVLSFNGRELTRIDRWRTKLSKERGCFQPSLEWWELDEKRQARWELDEKRQARLKFSFIIHESHLKFNRHLVRTRLNSFELVVTIFTMVCEIKTR